MSHSRNFAPKKHYGLKVQVGTAIIAVAAVLASGLTAANPAGAQGQGRRVPSTTNSSGNWSVVPTPSPTMAGKYPAVESRLESVSCVSDTDCLATGLVASQSSGVLLAQHWDGTSWSRITAPEVTLRHAPAYGSGLSGVACLSATDCWLVGGAVFSPAYPAVSYTLVEHWDGSGLTVVPSTGADVGWTNSLSSVACPTSSLCWAVGTSTGPDSPTQDLQGIIASSSGGPWTASVHGLTNDVFNDVSCGSATDCWAVGYSEPKLGTSDPLAFHWSGGSWAPSPVAPAPTSTGILLAVACATPTACWTVANPSNAQGSPTFELWDGASWSVVSAAALSGDTVKALTCAAPSTCVAVGYDFAGQPLVAQWNGTTWTAVATPTVPGSTTSRPGGWLYGVTCLSPSDCWAVGETLGGKSLAMHMSGNPLSVAISFPGTVAQGTQTFDEGRTFSAAVTLTVAPGTKQVSGLRFNGPPLQLSPGSSVQVVRGPIPAVHQPFSMGGGTTKTFTFELKALEADNVSASSSVSGVVANQNVSADDRLIFAVANPSPLLVTLDVTPATIKVDQTVDGATPVTVTVTASVTNRSRKAVDNVVVYRELSIGVLDHYHVASIPITQSGSPSPSPLLGTIYAGATKKVTYTLVVSGDGTYSLETIAQGLQLGRMVAAAGKAQMAPQSQLLFWSADYGREVYNPETPELIPGGTAFTIDITLEDRSYTSALVLAPMYPEDMSGNASDGHVQIAGLPIETVDQSAPNPSPYVELEPRQTKTLEMVVQTSKSDARFIPELVTKSASPPAKGGTHAYVTLPDFWPGWVVSDKDDTDFSRSLGEDDEVVGPDSQDFDESIDDAPLDRAELTVADTRYLRAGEVALAVPYAAQQLITGFWSFASETVPETLSAAFLGLTEIASYEADLWQGLLADPSQMSSFMSSVDQAISSAYNQVTNFPVLEAQAKALLTNANQVIFAHYAAIEQDEFDGDYDAAAKALSQEAVTTFVSIPGLPEASIGAASKVINVTGLAAARLVRWDQAADLLAAAQAAVKEKWTTFLVTASEEAANPVQDAKNLRDLQASFLGLPVPISRVPELFGYTATQMNSLLEFCKENDVIVTIRSRSSAALEWLSQPGGAALKPELFKMKTVDAIDEAFLGYAPPAGQQTVGSLVVRVPPSEAEVMATLRAKGIVEGSGDWDAVMARWKTRFNEFTKPANGSTGDVQDMVAWNKSGKVTTRWNWLNNDIQKPNELQTVGFRLVDLKTSERLPPGLQPRPGQSYAVEVQELGAGGAPAGPWQRVTGDADMVSITNPDGTGLTEEQHVKLLNLLRNSDLGVAHPDLATWTSWDQNNPFFFASKQQQLESGTFLQACPDGVLRAVKYSPQLTNIAGSPNGQVVNAYNYFLKFVGGCESPLSSVTTAGLPVG